MAGDWLKVEVTTPDKPEVHAMAEALGIDPDAVTGKLIRIWAWFDQHAETANDVSVSESLLDRIANQPGFTLAMANAGWIHPKQGKFTLPRFERHNGKTAKNRALTAKRVANHKIKSNADGNDPLTQTALPREEKRREEIKEKDIVGQQPDAPPPSNLNGKSQTRQQARDVLTFLNEKTGRNYQPVDANLEMIAARLKDGATVEDLRAVVAKKCREWGGDEKMSEYLRPATLFNRTKFANYQGELGGSNA